MSAFDGEWHGVAESVGGDVGQDEGVGFVVVGNSEARAPLVYRGDDVFLVRAAAAGRPRFRRAGENKRERNAFGVKGTDQRVEQDDAVVAAGEVGPVGGWQGFDDDEVEFESGECFHDLAAFPAESAAAFDVAGAVGAADAVVGGEFDGLAVGEDGDTCAGE